MGDIRVKSRDGQEEEEEHACPFLDFGCEYTDNRTKVKQHIKETPTRHLSYLCDGVGSLIRDVQKTQLLFERQERQLEGMLYRNRELDIIFSTQLIWRLDNYRYHVQEAKAGRKLIVFSPPFYSAKYGYKLAASANLIGDGSAKGKYMSVFLTIIQGEYDALQTWPFPCQVTFSLLDQRADRENRENIVQTIKPNTIKQNRAFLGKPVGERNPSFGVQKFASIRDALQAGEYLVDDVLFIKIELDILDLPMI